MRKRIPILRGLAILGVVSYHAAAWGHTAMFFWAHRFRQVESPNFDQFRSLTYYVLLAIERLAWFSVPAFLFVAGFSMAYSAAGDRVATSWKTVRARISHILWPYLIWSLVVFLGDASFLKITYSPVEYLRRLATGGAVGLYYFVPLLLQFYVMSPLITRAAKKKPVVVLVCAGGIQATMHYLIHFSGTRLGSVAYPWGFFHWAFFFPLGVVCFLHYKSVTNVLARLKWPLLVSAAILVCFSGMEVVAEFSRRFAFDDAHHVLSFSTSLYSLSFILAFLAFDKIKVPFSHFLQGLGVRSYGVYLLHFSVQTVVAKLVYHFAPWLFRYQMLYVPLLLLTGLGLPLLLMKVIARSGLRRYYWHLFGGAPPLPMTRKPLKKDVTVSQTSSPQEASRLGTAPTRD